MALDQYRMPEIFAIQLSALLTILKLAQAGIAMLSLTYGFNVDTSAVLLTHGDVTIPNMTHFYPWGDNSDPNVQDEQYIAHCMYSLRRDFHILNSFWS